MTDAPMIGGVRRHWTEIPGGLRRRIEADLGAPVAEAVTQPGGFSPGVAARLLLADGRRAFVKAVGPTPNPDSPDLHRSEARIARLLPADAPVPRLLASYGVDGWVALTFEDIDGHLPAQPWRAHELDLVLAAMTDLAESLTPSTVDVPTYADRHAAAFTGWRTIVADGALADRIDDWSRRHLDTLAELEATWEPLSAGTTLLHADLRADNILLTDDRVVFVDWPWACTGAPWLDLLGMLPSVAMHGGPDPETVFGTHPLSAAAPPEAVTAVLAAAAGFFIGNGILPPPPGLPMIREFQLAQGRVALDWLRVRTGWR
ncbi:phosphotransferase family protein [Labedaea rhizosphaerae]|uniref:Aminoglycoside phosphotransferase (APT) family kinase protein n=1 Tax=Labedaea rhizosphaerae TaxID=598644 RepID=A0A4V6PVM6_LABRH|nr:phosphotransferase [Labedaea rhizosphaerae]TDP91138.1 aminoglycoside phosphotransferase (APT) family kinase protein [Labedaea rhizosphaerae]